MGSINTPLSITDLTVCSASLVYAAFARYNVPLKSDLRTRMQHWSGIICNIEGVWYSTIFIKSAGIWKGVSWLLTKMALSCLRELVLGLLFLWLSARWALHSPDNHQRIIFHALCLVKLCALYFCWKIKLLLLLFFHTFILFAQSRIHHGSGSILSRPLMDLMLSVSTVK